MFHTYHVRGRPAYRIGTSAPATRIPLIVRAVNSPPRACPVDNHSCSLQAVSVYPLLHSTYASYICFRFYLHEPYDASMSRDDWRCNGGYGQPQSGHFPTHGFEGSVMAALCTYVVKTA